MVLFFDTETTGLYPGQICQISYILQDKSSVKAKNFYFSVDYVEPGAYSVHHLSVSLLNKLSCGKTFAHCAQEILNDFQSADVVIAHNYNFDFMFLRTEFERLNLSIVIKNDFCTMKSLTPVFKIPRSKGLGYKYPKLQEMCDCFNVCKEEISNCVEELFGTSSDFHDATFDTAALYLAVNKGFCHVQCLNELRKLL